MKRAVIGMVLLASTASNAVDLPSFQDPARHQMVERYKNDVNLRDPGKLFAGPADPVQNGCSVPESLPYRLAGLFELHSDLKAEADAERKLSRKMALDAGLDPTAVPAPQYSNLKITPIRIPCVNGALNGSYGVLLSYDEMRTERLTMPMGAKVVNATITSSINWTRRIETKIVNGSALLEHPERAEYLLMATRSESHYDDPDMEKATRQMQIETKPQFSVTYVDGRVTASFSPVAEFKAEKGLFSLTGVNTQKVLGTMFMNQVDERHQVAETFEGPQLRSRVLMRDGVPHGESITVIDNIYKILGQRVDQQPGMENARAVTINGKDLIEIPSRYQEGHLVKMQPCPAE